MPKELETKVVFNSNNEEIGRFWWDPEEEKVKYDTQEVFNVIDNILKGPYVIEDGKPFLRYLPRYSNGYISVSRVK